MKNVCCSLIILLISGFAHAQHFPADFIGNWKGEIDWFQQGKAESKKVPM